MAKVLRCSETGVDCTWEGRADTEKELLEMALKHAAEVHNESFTQDEIEGFRSFIHDE